MDLKRLTEWLGTAEGAGKGVAALLSTAGSIGAATTKALDPFAKNLPAWVLPGCAFLLIAGFAVVLWRGFQRFAQASRLERPDAFVLRPTDPDALIGRTTDLANLINAVNRNRVVLLDGESGCGKSALISAGLIPRLQQTNGLLPLVIRDWGDEWVRGPLSAALEALFGNVSQADRDRLGWTSPPDLAADSVPLENDLDARLKAVFDGLGRRPLLVADQFDDYQALHHSHFVDNEGNWLAPAELAKVNRFWALISAGLAEGRLHLLVVTRADMGSGLSCVRFLDKGQTAERRLPRVEPEFLRPLLGSIAPENAQPPVVSNPAGGWYDLRERLEENLKAEGAVLMQQVRTVLLGLRQLPLLTPSRYRAAGGLRGVETLVISRALGDAATAAGGGEAGLRTARAVLGSLILPGGPNQPPKARSALLSNLKEIAGDQSRTVAILKALQRDEVVRPAEVDKKAAWQLDHDYLARPVLAEAQQADRWSIALRESKARYDEVAGNWRHRWAALLSVRVLARICWERARRRLAFGEAAGYVWASAIKVGIAVVALILIGTGAYILNQDRLLTAEAHRLIDNFRGSGEQNAVLQIWRAAEPLRQRVYELVREDNARRERACLTSWPVAHAGLEPSRAREAAGTLRAALERARPDNAAAFAQAYAAVAARLSDQADLKAAATALRAALEQARPDNAAAFAQAYAAVAARLSDQADLKAAATVLRAALEQARPDDADAFAQAYAAVARAIVERPDTKDRSAIVQEILLLAGQPFLNQLEPFLSGLEPAAGANFNGDIAAAVRWAEQKHGIKPRQLRPPPLPH